jgi:hypothetical protein
MPTCSFANQTAGPELRSSQKCSSWSYQGHKKRRGWILPLENEVFNCDLPCCLGRFLSITGLWAWEFLIQRHASPGAFTSSCLRGTRVHVNTRIKPVTPTRSAKLQHFLSLKRPSRQPKLDGPASACEREAAQSAFVSHSVVSAERGPQTGHTLIREPCRTRQ